ncbi:6729_t:CDS:2 [Diversispora eburnea]|uniref:6729_t:CDS:1 n=1 Tax=Diversispora eburnea TaxID=1213867 RepID=A0A9N9G4D8_9GLOM|nr:6729_t:CDS:2 [Diversispora eburnea]
MLAEQVSKITSIIKMLDILEKKVNEPEKIVKREKEKCKLDRQQSINPVGTAIT